MRAIYLLLLLMTSVACQKMDEDDTTVMQIERIEDYLENKDIDFVYRDNIYIEYVEEAEADDDVRLIEGDSVYINYALFTFYKEPNTLYSTNIEEVANEEDFNTENAIFAPQGLKYGQSNMIKGLYSGLRGARKGDIFNIYMPSDMAYGGIQNGIVPAYSSIMVYVEIDKIVKQQ